MEAQCAENKGKLQKNKKTKQKYHIQFQSHLGCFHTYYLRWIQPVPVLLSHSTNWTFQLTSPHLRWCCIMNHCSRKRRRKKRMKTTPQSSIGSLQLKHEVTVCLCFPLELGCHIHFPQGSRQRGGYTPSTSWERRAQQQWSVAVASVWTTSVSISFSIKLMKLRSISQWRKICCHVVRCHPVVHTLFDERAINHSHRARYLIDS